MALLAAVAGAPLCAQEAADSSIVQEEELVVKGAALPQQAAGATVVPIDDAQPFSDQSWASLAAPVGNFRVDSGGTSSFGSIYSLRGLSNTPYFSDPAVTLYVDDIPLGSSFTYPTDLFGFGSAAVYRGPQPTEFGRGGEGGVIWLQLPDPPAGFGGEVRADLGDYQARSAAVEAGGSSGKGDFTVVATGSERSGYVTNTQIGQPVDDQRVVTALARGRLHPTPSSEVSLEILADRHRDGAQPLVPLDGPLYTVQRAREGETDTDLLGAALKAAFDTSVGRLTSVTSATSYQLNPYEDWLVLPPPLDSYLTLSQKDWNEELRLASNPGGGGTGPGLAWSVGAWWSDRQTSGSVDRTISGLEPYQDTDYAYTYADGAVFGQVVLTPAPLWQISVGLRAERGERNYDQNELIPTAGLHFHFVGIYDSLSPKLTVSRRLPGDTTVHATLAFGSKPGGFSGYTENPKFIPFAAEHTADLEAGIDTALAEKTVTVGADVFAYEIENYQIERSFNAANYFVATAPKAQSLGGELEAQWRPGAAWFLRASGGLTDVTLREFHDPLTGQSYAGDRAPYAPTFTADLSGGWRPARGFFAWADFSATGRTFYTEYEDPLYSQAPYGVLGARAGYEAARWRLTVYGDNLTARGYYTLIIPGVNSGVPGAPRTFGTELAWKF